MLELNDAAGVLELLAAGVDDDPELELELPADGEEELDAEPDDEPDEGLDAEPDEFDPEPFDAASGSVYC